MQRKSLLKCSVPYCCFACRVVSAYDPFPARAYTGSLRACYQKNKLHVSKKAVDQVTKAYFSDSYFTALQNPRDPSQRRHVPPHIPRPNYADDSELITTMSGLILSSNSHCSVNGDAKYTRLGERRPRELESWEQEGMRRVCKVGSSICIKLILLTCRTS